MIQPNELRLGNWITKITLYPPKSDIFEISTFEIGYNDSYVLLDKNIKHINSITLTEGRYSGYKIDFGQTFGTDLIQLNEISNIEKKIFAHEVLKKGSKLLINYSDSDDKHVKFNGSLDMNVSYDPVLLTDKILLECGFDNNMVLFHSSGRLLYNPSSGLLQIGGLKSSDTFSVYWFYHLHQLQNLYFALTGKELEVKL